MAASALELTAVDSIAHFEGGTSGLRRRKLVHTLQQTPKGGAQSGVGKNACKGREFGPLCFVGVKPPSASVMYLFCKCVPQSVRRSRTRRAAFTWECGPAGNRSSSPVRQQQPDVVATERGVAAALRLGGRQAVGVRVVGEHDRRATRGSCARARDWRRPM